VGPIAAPASASIAVGAGSFILVALGRALQQRLQRRDSVRLNRRVGATLNGKAQGTVERRELVRPQPLGLPLPEPHPGHANPTFHFIVERHRITPEMQPARQRLQPFSGLVVYQLPGIE
jgi:hypothetical protein